MAKKIQLFIILLLTFSFMFVFAGIVVAESPKFIYPSDKTLIYVSELRVIGESDGSSSVTIHVENSAGKKSYELTPADKHFELKLQLSTGKNMITLSTASGITDSMEIILANENSAVSELDDYLPYYLHTKNDVTGKCGSCHPKGENNITRYDYVVQKQSCITNTCHPKFDEGEFPHKPFQKGDCVGCHNPHGTENKNFLKYFGADLCFSCHTDAEKMAMEAKHVHFPVSRGECTACHDPHTSNLEFHLKRESIVGLCAGCHGTLVTDHKVLHEPVKMGDCIVCHSPHISENKALLTGKGNQLCFKCHKVRKEEFEREYVHEPVRKDCTICHDPHGSETIYHLKNKKDDEGNYISVAQPFKELCLNCHRILDPEIVDQIDNGTTRHEPVDQGKCTLCHTPHSTNNKKQLRLPIQQICYSCHKDKEEQIKSSEFKHGPIRTNGCAECHLPHGSQHRKLLRSNFSDEFNVEFNIKNYELCFNCHNAEMLSKKESDNTTGFRNGRKNLHYLHVRTQGRNCKVCHNIHASDQELHIRKKIRFSKSFIIYLKYTRTPSGGGCADGCHKPRQYDRIKPIINE